MFFRLFSRLFGFLFGAGRAAFLSLLSAIFGRGPGPEEIAEAQIEAAQRQVVELTHKIDTKRKAASPKRKLSPSAIVKAAGEAKAAGCNPNFAEMAELQPEHFAWIDNLTQEQAIIANRHTGTAILAHMKGEIVADVGLPPPLNGTQIEEMKRVMVETDQQFKDAHGDPETAEPESVAQYRP